MTPQGRGGRGEVRGRCLTRRHRPGPPVFKKRWEAEAPQGKGRTGDRAAHRAGAGNRPGDARHDSLRGAYAAGLATEVKKGKAPAAELILLPDGGELKPESIAPVLKAFDRIRHARQRVEECLQSCEDKRSTAGSRAGYSHRDANATNEHGNARDCRSAPRWSSTSSTSCAKIMRSFDALDDVPRPERTAARHELEKRTGTAPAPFLRDLRRGYGSRKTRSARPSASCSKRTCGWWCPSPSATRTAGCRCST